MKLSTKYQAKGLFHEVRGTVKEATAKISSNTVLGVKGKIERIAGKIQWKIGKAHGLLGL